MSIDAAEILRKIRDYMAMVGKVYCGANTATKHGSFIDPLPIPMDVNIEEFRSMHKDA